VIIGKGRECLNSVLLIPIAVFRFASIWPANNSSIANATSGKGVYTKESKAGSLPTANQR